MMKIGNLAVILLSLMLSTVFLQGCGEKGLKTSPTAAKEGGDTPKKDTKAEKEAECKNSDDLDKLKLEVAKNSADLVILKSDVKKNHAALETTLFELIYREDVTLSTPNNRKRCYGDGGNSLRCPVSHTCNQLGTVIAAGGGRDNVCVDTLKIVKNNEKSTLEDGVCLGNKKTVPCKEGCASCDFRHDSI